MRTRFFLPLLALAAILPGACGGDDDSPETTGPGDSATPATTGAADSPAATTAPGGEFTLTSGAFAEGAAIPEQYTCDGPNTSPPLAWSNVPDGTAELALVVDDPDAPGGSFIHWVIWGLDPAGAIEEGAVPDGALEGTNDSGGTGWFGPCPPEGTHHYRFELHALSAPLDLPEGATVAPELRDAVSGSTIATTVLTGTYQR